MINTDDCWLYAGYKSNLGYGQLWHKSKRYIAHRVSYETFVKPIPHGLVIDHLCKVRHCINPEHLEPVTARENTLRGDGVLLNKQKTHCPKGHEYTPENTVSYSNKWRRCRKCISLKNKSYYTASKAHHTLNYTLTIQVCSVGLEGSQKSNLRLRDTFG